MMTINKQDVFKTILIIWFVATTGYVIYDLYAGYKFRGIQAAYQQGYAQSVSDLFDQSDKSQCKGFEVRKDDKKITLVDVTCLQKPADQQQGAAQTPSPAVKK